MKERRAKLLTINKAAARVFHKWLYAPEGAAGLAYLSEARAAPGDPDPLRPGLRPRPLGRSADGPGGAGATDKADLLDAGLAVSNKDGRIYDRFRNRVMFPIIDIRGDVIGFGGRVMDDSTPKYLNSPDTPVLQQEPQSVCPEHRQEVQGGAADPDGGVYGRHLPPPGGL